MPQVLASPPSGAKPRARDSKQLELSPSFSRWLALLSFAADLSPQVSQGVRTFLAELSAFPGPPPPQTFPIPSAFPLPSPLLPLEAPCRSIPATPSPTPVRSIDVPELHQYVQPQEKAGGGACCSPQRRRRGRRGVSLCALHYTATGLQWFSDAFRVVKRRHRSYLNLHSDRLWALAQSYAFMSRIAIHQFYRPMFSSPSGWTALTRSPAGTKAPKVTRMK
ncbi:hypothetical protein CONLIGDRAFT_263927 [Coniochaeta ligniaria NRRL 30616]|uniref:Uncharacterized protein n=1 Tax=Coniochaeta ligniaria NRRL 30616 TaxID=1408157 RepID=A0A1J7IYM1_9PEZI|nr:hypothetical protein CONLIGDRAFT_263927 [Coniochaeta ligniaria NRRL 30616]